MRQIRVTCECAPNIALIKYWGKANEELIVPLNSSISITLDRNVLSSRTTLTLTPDNLNKLTINLNESQQELEDVLDENEPIVSNKSDLISRRRLFKMLHKVRKNCSLENPESYSIEIDSVNNFPTACGLASSASGFACLALCLAQAFKYQGDTSELARLGSGSASRSCFGGFVAWLTARDPVESVSSSLASNAHWPEMNVLALVLEDQRKSVSSTDGMRDSVLTSEALKARVEMVNQTRFQQMRDAIRDKNFDRVAELTMKDSNSFHSVCMDTYPPLFYLNDKSKEIIQLITQFNNFEKRKSSVLKAAYSFDAGPNAFLFVLDEHLAELLYLIYTLYFADSMSADEWVNDRLVADKEKLQSSNMSLSRLSPERKLSIIEISQAFKRQFKIQSNVNTIKYVIHSKVGPDPLVSESLEVDVLIEEYFNSKKIKSSF
jgi:diphosphomevalonate decarboxylase